MSIPIKLSSSSSTTFLLGTSSSLNPYEPLELSCKLYFCIPIDIHIPKIVFGGICGSVIDGEQKKLVSNEVWQDCPRALDGAHYIYRSESMVSINMSRGQNLSIMYQTIENMYYLF